MKQYITPIIILGILIACHNNQPGKPFTKLSTSDSLIKRFASIINGDWVDVDYVKDLEETKSAYLSYRDGAAGSDDEIYIDTGMIAGDTMTVVVEDGDGSAGPGEYTLFFKHGKAPNSLVMLESWRYDTSGTNLSFELTKTDTTLILYRYNKAGTAITYTRKYERVRNEFTNDDTITTISNMGLSYFNNKIIISGNYVYVDSLGQKHEVMFNDFGKVKGFGHFKTYYIEDVFSQGPGDDTDVITFNIYKEGQKDYIFKLNKDTLKLFDFESSDISDSIYSSSLKYTLVRKQYF